MEYRAAARAPRPAQPHTGSAHEARHPARAGVGHHAQRHKRSEQACAPHALMSAPQHGSGLVYACSGCRSSGHVSVTASAWGMQGLSPGCARARSPSLHLPLSIPLPYILFFFCSLFLCLPPMACGRNAGCVPAAGLVLVVLQALAHGGPTMCGDAAPPTRCPASWPCCAPAIGVRALRSRECSAPHAHPSAPRPQVRAALAAGQGHVVPSAGPGVARKQVARPRTLRVFLKQRPESCVPHCA